MELTFTKLDVFAARNRGVKLVDIIKRRHANEIWFVPFKPLDFVNTPDWRTYRREPHIVIPVFPYLTQTSLSDALGFAFQLGVRAMHDLGSRPARRLHLVIGEQIEQVPDTNNVPVWRLHLGFGVVLSEGS